MLSVVRSVRDAGKLKTIKSHRRPALPALAVTALKAHKLAPARMRRKAAELWQENDLVFCSEVGTELDHHNVRRAFAKITEAATGPPGTAEQLSCRSCPTTVRPSRRSATWWGTTGQRSPRASTGTMLRYCLTTWSRSTGSSARHPEGSRLPRSAAVWLAGAPPGHENAVRDVAQFGSALDWGSRGRRFKSGRPDHWLAGQKGFRILIRDPFPDLSEPAGSLDPISTASHAATSSVPLEPTARAAFCTGGVDGEGSNSERTDHRTPDRRLSDLQCEEEVYRPHLTVPRPAHTGLAALVSCSGQMSRIR